MQPSLLLQILKVLDNLYVVAFFALVVIGIRLLWVRGQKKKRVAEESALKSRKDKRGKVSSEVQAPKKDYTLEVIDTLLIALILVFGIIRPFILSTFFIPSASMEPTLLSPYDPNHVPPDTSVVVGGPKRSGDKLIANKFVYLFRKPERGQVVVFKPPIEAIIGNDITLISRQWLEENPDKMSFEELNVLFQILEQNDPRILKTGNPVRSSEELLALLPQPPTNWDDFIKRVIGQPGDHIRFSNGKVFVNGVEVPSSVTTNPENFPDPLTKPTIKRILDPVKGEQIEWNIIPWIRQWYYYYHLRPKLSQLSNKDGEIYVPEDAIFVMGDNREHSFDSRFWGVVTLKDVKARAVSTIWPIFNSSGWHLRLL